MAQQVGTLQPMPLPAARPARGGSWLLMLLTWLLALAVVAGAALWRYETLYVGRIHEGVRVAGVALGGFTPEEARSELAAALAPLAAERLTLRAGDRAWHPTLAELGVRVESEATIAQAMRQGREGPLPQQLAAQWRLLQQGSELAPVVTRDGTAVDAFLSEVARELAREPRDASLVLEGLTARALPAEAGRQLDVAASRAAVAAALDSGARGEVALVVTERPPTLVGAEAAAAQINTFLAAPLQMAFTVQEFQRTAEGAIAPLPVTRQWTIDRARLAELLRIEQRQRDDGQREYSVGLDATALRADLEAIATEIAREPREPRFDYDPQSDTLRPLVVSQDGLALDVDAALGAVQQALAAGTHEIALPVTVIPPVVSTADAARMKIHGLAAEGRSTFATSSPSREVNVIETARRMHGVVIPPGGEFSFNEYLGWVVAATGYEEAYIIVGNETQVDVGGGVCQVSTTLFRAALNAGFPITERNAHGYRVSYYEQDAGPGLDATVFSPWVDFKFRNDTENYYLVESEWDRTTKALAIKFYGPETGRTVEILGPTIIRETPPGPDIYVDDPTLPAGTVEQVDWSHPGAEVKVERVVRDEATGQVLFRDSFWSNYRSWSARYLRGTGN